MPAASESVVFSSESAFLFAAQDILVTVGGLSTSIVRLDGDFDNLPDECAIVKFVDFGMKDLENEFSDSERTRGWAVGATEQVVGTGQLSIAYRLLKTANAVSSVTGLYRVIDEKAGLIRKLFAKHNRNFTIGRLPYHGVINIQRQAPSRGVDNANNVERQVIEEHFLITYEILPTAWPTV